MKSTPRLAIVTRDAETETIDLAAWVERYARVIARLESVPIYPSGREAA